jgi:GNAT superfamily N-acetyltransferase
MALTTITPIASDRMEETIGVLARAYVTNPLHVSAFGPSALASNEVFFRVGLQVMKGEKVVAMGGSRILGVAHWVHSADCQYSVLEKLRVMPQMVRGFGLRTAVKVVSWLSEWSHHDPNEPHLHLGPIAVEPEAQGRQIGSSLMERYCETADRMGVTGYLETDRRMNVDFYERFGFDVIDTTRVLGVQNYFMRRP